MELQLEQKFRSEEQRSSLGVPRFLTALYFLNESQRPFRHRCKDQYSLGEEIIWQIGSLDQVFPVKHLQTVGDPAQINRTHVSAHFATNAAGA